MMSKLALDGGIPASAEFIPLSSPWVGEPEVEAAKRTILGGNMVGDGPECKRVSALLAKIVGSKHMYLTPSGTASLDLAIMALELEPGDEVICPTYTFVSSANAIVRQGARPVFIDVCEDTFNMNVELLEPMINENTKAIMPVHYAGQGCDMMRIEKIAKQNDIAVVEDAAQCIGATYQGKPLGSWGKIGCFSFHNTKNIVSGEGGAICTDDEELARKIEIMREKGTNRASFLRGEIDKYTWVSEGSNYVMSDLLAAVLGAQLERLEEVTRLRKQHAAYLLEKLKPLEPKIKLPVVLPQSDTNWHIFAIMVPPEKLEWFIKAMKAEGVGATAHFVPLHLSPYAREHLGTRPGDYPVSEKIASSIVRLPLYAQMTLAQLDAVIAATVKVVEKL